MTKYISLERSESQDSIFGDITNIEREIHTFVTENAYKISLEFGWHLVAICGITS